MMSFKKVFLLVGVFFISCNAFSAEINIDSIMKANVAPWLMQKSSQECEPLYTKYLMYKMMYGALRASGYKAKWVECVNKYSTSLPIENITITAGAVRVSQVSNSPLPISIDTKKFVYSNCSSTPIVTQSTEQIVVQDGLSITTKDSVKTSASIKATIPVKIVTAELNLSKEVSFERAETTNETTTKTSTLQINKEIPPYTVLVVSQEIKQFNSWFDFDGDLYLNGLVAKAFEYKSIVPNNFVSVAGQVFNSTSQLSSLSYVQKDLNPSTCAILQSVSSVANQKMSMPSAGDKNSKLIALDGVAVGYKNSIVNDKPVSLNYYDGVVVSTSDVIANLQVRAKASAHEVNPCSAAFYAGNEKVEFVVVPNAWSEWKVITTYIGKSSMPVSKIASCKYDISAELSYL